MKIASDTPAKKKPKFPWATVFLTGVVATIGTVVAMKIISEATKKRDGDDELDTQRAALLNPHSIAALPQAVQPVPDPRMVVLSEDVLLQLTQSQIH